MKHRGTKIIFQATAFLLIFSSIAFAQDKKVRESIIIDGGDTIINGQNLSKVSEEKRAALRKKFMDMEKELTEKRIFLKNSDLHVKDVILKHPGKPHIRKLEEGNVRVYSMNGDTTVSRILRKFDGVGESVITAGPGRMKSFNLHEQKSDLPGHGFGFHREMSNSQSFSYNSTDKDAIASRANIRISDAKEGQLKRITGTEKPEKELQLEDLTLFPNFSSGKMALAFNLGTKGSTTIKILDSDYKTVFSDQTNVSGSYYKQFALPKNGIYYLYIKQGDASAAKRIVKE